MKKVIVFFVFVILFQSCYSYKKVENNLTQYEVGKYYKIKQGKKSDKVKIISKTDSTLVVNHKLKEKEISINSISNAEKRKFSIVKTVLLPVIIVVVTVALVASSMKVNLGEGGGGLVMPPRP